MSNKKESYTEYEREGFIKAMKHLKTVQEEFIGVISGLDDFGDWELSLEAIRTFEAITKFRAIINTLVGDENAITKNL